MGGVPPRIGQNATNWPAAIPSCRSIPACSSSTRATSSPAPAVRRASIFACTSCARTTAARSPTRLARQLVVPPQRDGGQAQYIEKPLPVLDSSDLFADTVAWVQEHLDEIVTVEDLAARSAMSPRTLRPAIRGRYRNHPVPVATPPACPARSTAPRSH